MHIDIPEITRCCICFPLLCGILTWAYMKLFLTVLVLPLFCLLSLAYYTVAYNEHGEHCFLFLTFVIMAIDVIFDILLIVATHKKSISMWMFYIKYAAVHPVTIIILTITWIGYEIFGQNIDFSSGRTQKQLLMSLSLVVSFLLLHIYILFIIVNEILKLQSENELRVTNHNSTEPECNMQPPDVEQAV